MFQSLRKLFGVLSDYQFHYVGATLLLFVSIFARTLEPRILEFTVDYIIGTAGEGPAPWPAWLGTDRNLSLSALLLLAGGAYMMVALIRGGFLLAATALKDFATEKSIKRLRDQVFAHIQRLPLAYFTGTSRGELIQRCTGDIDTVKRFIHHQIIAMLRLSATFIFSLAMMWLINWQYALISVALSPLILVLGYLFFRREKAVWQDHEREADRLNNIVQENLHGIRVVTAFSNQAFEIERFGRQNERNRTVGYRQARLHAFFWPLTDLVVNVQMIISILVGGYFAVSDRISIGELLSFQAYISMVTLPMRQLGKILSQVGMHRVSEIISSPEESDPVPADHTAGLAGEIEFRNVSFRYRPTDPQPALDRVSFRIRAGEKVGLTGPAGAGKSTIIKLLLRFYEPDSGQILLDSRDIREFSKAQIREKIGVGLQKPFLFSTTIRQNIAYSDPRMTDPAVDEAARIAQALEMKKRFPGGFQTLVGEKGVTLSGGQKQRVALARMMASEPDVLILDDVTSAVDAGTERAIFRALHQRGRRQTTLIISHGVASLRQADQLIVLERGRVAQQGPPGELLARQGYLRQVFSIQSEPTLQPNPEHGYQP
jgi:ATP-binding cassette, subfamily B, bacterial